MDRKNFFTSFSTCIDDENIVKNENKFFDNFALNWNRKRK